MLSRRLSIFLLAISGVLLYFGYFQENTMYYKIAIPFLLATVTIYVMGPQIDWKYYQKNPPELDDRLRFIINQHSTFYQNLSLEGKKRFRDRVALYMMAHDYVGMPKKAVPEDVKGIAAACAVQLTFGLPDFRNESFEKIIVYNHPFPSPQFPQNLHISETQREDGVILYSAPHLVKGFTEPTAYFNIGFYENMQIFQQIHPNKNFPTLPSDIADQLSLVSSFNKHELLEYVGLPKLNMFSLAVTYFLSFPERFKELLPNLYDVIKDMLNLNPIDANQPIVYINESR